LIFQVNGTRRGPQAQHWIRFTVPCESHKSIAPRHGSAGGANGSVFKAALLDDLNTPEAMAALHCGRDDAQ